MYKDANNTMETRINYHNPSFLLYTAVLVMVTYFIVRKPLKMTKCRFFICAHFSMRSNNWVHKFIMMKFVHYCWRSLWALSKQRRNWFWRCYHWIAVHVIKFITPVPSTFHLPFLGKLQQSNTSRARADVYKRQLLYSLTLLSFDTKTPR